MKIVIKKVMIKWMFATDPRFCMDSVKYIFWGLLFLFIPCFCFGKKLVYCSEGSPSFFNPQLASDGPSFDISSEIYDRLVEFNKKKVVLDQV